MRKNLKETMHYARQGYRAEIRLIAINGEPVHPCHEQNVNIIKTRSWANYSKTPEYLYEVFDTTKPEKMRRGFIFCVGRDWTCIIRVGEISYWNLHPTLDDKRLWTRWCKTPSDATEKVIMESRTYWGKKPPPIPGSKCKNNQKSGSSNYQGNHYSQKSQSSNHSHQKNQAPRLGAHADYQTLGLSRQQYTLAELKTAYRRMSLKHHPDRGGNAAKFTEVNAAYTRLKTYLEAPSPLNK
jgi:hypothetical protein